LNVVILRYNSGLSPMKGRSKCFSCGHGLVWYDLVPLFSFLKLLGKCHYCGVKLSWQYPIVEFLSASVFVALYLKFGLSLDFIFFAIIFSLLLVISVYDFRHKIIPNGLVYAFIFLGLFYFGFNSLLSGNFNTDIIWSTLASFLFFASLWFFSAGRWMGFGDAKLAVGIGLLTTPCQNLSVVAFSFILGAIISIIYILTVKVKTLFFRRTTSIDKEIPFAPFLVISFALVILTGIDYCLMLYV